MAFAIRERVSWEQNSPIGQEEQHVKEFNAGFCGRNPRRST